MARATVKSSPGQGEREPSELTLSAARISGFIAPMKALRASLVGMAFWAAACAEGTRPYGSAGESGSGGSALGGSGGGVGAGEAGTGGEDSDSGGADPTLRVVRPNPIISRGA